jgi:hypothetical protein
VDDRLVVDVLETFDDAGDEKPGFLLVKLPALGQPVPEVSSGEQVHNQIQIIPVLESVLHIDQEVGLELAQYFPLVEYGINASFVKDSGLSHLLHGKHLAVFLTLDLPDLAKASLPDGVLVAEVVLLDGHVDLCQVLGLEFRTEITVAHAGGL